MEAAWPRPIPYVSRRKEEEYLREARRRSSVLLGYDIFGQPFYWSDDTRTMQSNAFGMTGAGKTNLLETVTEQDILRGVPIIFIDGKELAGFSWSNFIVPETFVNSPRTFDNII